MTEPVEQLAFEQALARLEAVVRDLESTETGLDKSLERYEDGVRLLKRCRSILEAAEQKILLLTRAESNGTVVTEKFEVTAVEVVETEAVREPTPNTQRNTARAVRRSNTDLGDREEQLF